MTETDTADDRIREEFREFPSDEDGGVIADPRNDRAWIASTLICTVEQ